MSVQDIDKYKLPAYLKERKCDGNKESTNTRIGSQEANIYGGNYHIPEGEYSVFLDKYYKHVFVKNNIEYLTEKQLIEDGPILLDLDLHYDTSITSRQHNKENIVDFVMSYMAICDKVIDIPENTSIEIYVMEKPTVNKLKEKTKDGIHLLIGLTAHKSVQSYIRTELVKVMSDVWDDLPIINSWDDVLDEGVVKGYTNWQLYGSRKPNHDAYVVTQLLIIKKKTLGWSTSEENLNNFDMGENIYKLSARCKSYPIYKVREEMEDTIEDNKKHLSKNKSSTKPLRKTISVENLKMNDIKNQQVLDDLLEDIFEDPETDHSIKEVHDFTMALPNQYYGPGSFSKWIRVGWAISNSVSRKDNRTGFLIFLRFSSQDNCRATLSGANNDFDWDNVDDLWNQWDDFETSNSEGGLTAQSIRYWCREDNRKRYDEINETSVRALIDETIAMSPDNKDRGATEYEIARVAKQLYKDVFVCVSIKQNCWYTFKDQRWFEDDSANTLLNKISTDLHTQYQKIISEKCHNLNNMEEQNENYEARKRQINRLCDITNYLRKTSWKSNIMKECAGLFYDRDFMNKLDQNPYLLCCKNYVIDFEKKTHRKGLPEDYLSNCTNIDYVQYNETKNYDTMQEITEFFDQLFPNPELRHYMWEHLASCCLGTILNQTFNIYTGSGRNGKSKLVDLMSKVLGDYKGTIPITLITQKRNSIGSTSSEIVQLKGTRYAVMQEPSKGDKINEGIMKEITGGDPIQGRALFKDTITFIPQFKLVVCTNTLFDIKSNDDGTWRRIRVCDFMSKFLDKPYEEDEKFPKESFPHQYPIDKNIDSKFNKWAPVLLSMFVNLLFQQEDEHRGKVSDCNIVMNSSDSYREGQDYLTEFDKDMVVREKNQVIKKTVLQGKFKEWYESNYGRGNVPKGKELNDYMDAKYGKSKRKKNTVVWEHVKLIEEADPNDEEEEDEESNDLVA